MSIVRIPEEKHRNQQKAGHTKNSENHRRAAKLLVVDVHHSDHRENAGGRPGKLLEQEAVWRTETLLGHDGRSAEDHHQSNEDEQESYTEEPLVHAYPL